MGVPGLWPLLAPAATSHNLEILDLGSLTGNNKDGGEQRLPVVGVDLSAWLFHARLSVEGSNPLLRLIFFRLVRLLSLPLRAVFVFDGPLRPKIKRGRTVGGKKHPLTGPLMEMIKACGAVGWEAPGEAEAELANMNRQGLIDAVLSDDVDSLVFGARSLMRNWSATTSSNSVASASSSEASENAVTIFKASDIEEIPDLGLDQDGLVLVAVLAGGDYDLSGLGGCGAKMAVALAQGGYGRKLADGFKKYCAVKGYDPDSKLPTVEISTGWSAFRRQWLEEVRSELETNRQGFLSTRQVKLAQSDAFKTLLESPESLEVLASYVHPVTTWSLYHNGIGPSQSMRPPPRSLRFEDPSLPAMAAFAQRTFAWGPKATVGRLRNVAWKGFLLTSLREQSQGGSSPCNSSRLDIELVQVHSERRHQATGLLLEYRLEWNPRHLALEAEKGIDPLLNVGPGYDEPFPEDNEGGSSTSRVASPMSGASEAEEDEDEEAAMPPSSLYGWTPSPSKRKAKPPPDPYSHLRTWVLAERLLSTPRGRQLVDEYRQAKAGGSKKPRAKKTSARAALPASQRTIDSIFFTQKPSSKPSSNMVKASKGSAPKPPTAPLTYANPATPVPSQKDQAGDALQLPSRSFGRTQSSPAATMGVPVEAGALDTITSRRRGSVASLFDDDCFPPYRSDHASEDDDNSVLCVSPPRRSLRVRGQEALPSSSQPAPRSPNKEDPDCSLPDAMQMLKDMANPHRRSAMMLSSSSVDSSPDVAASKQKQTQKRMKRIARPDLREGSSPPHGSKSAVAQHREDADLTEDAKTATKETSQSRSFTRFRPRDKASPTALGTSAVNGARRRGGRKSDAIVLSDTE
ncbi:unnamed protein product [Jaminaea pallidilutea]